MGCFCGTYDPKMYQVIMGGVPLHGFADGTYLVIERDEDTFKKIVGADGCVSRVKTNDKSSTVTLTLTQTSDSNDILSAFFKIDELSNKGVVSFMIKDLMGSTLLFGADSWIIKPANVELSKEVGTREWKIQVACFAQEWVGGSGDISAETVLSNIRASAGI